MTDQRPVTIDADLMFRELERLIEEGRVIDTHYLIELVEIYGEDGDPLDWQEAMEFISKLEIDVEFFDDDDNAEH